MRQLIFKRKLTYDLNVSFFFSFVLIPNYFGADRPYFTPRLNTIIFHNIFAHTSFPFTRCPAHIRDMGQTVASVLFRTPCTTSFVRQAQVSENSNHLSQEYLIFKNVSNLFIMAVYLKL